MRPLAGVSARCMEVAPAHRQRTGAGLRAESGGRDRVASAAGPLHIPCTKNSHALPSLRLSGVLKMRKALVSLG